MHVRVCGGSLSQLITTIHYFPYEGEGWADRGGMGGV